MSKPIFTIDERGYRALLDRMSDLSGKELNRARRSALRSGANKARRRIVSTMESSMVGSRQLKTSTNHYTGRPWRDSIVVSKAEPDEAVVRIRTRRGRKTLFLVWIFEGGTVPRSVKVRGRLANRGRITGLHFFARGWNIAEPELMPTIENSLMRQIVRLWDRKQK